MKIPRLTTVKPKLSVAKPPHQLKTATVAARRKTGRALQADRMRLWLERGQCCESCGRFVEHPGGYQLDHITPLSAGGSNADENLQLLCWWLEDGVAMGCHVDKTCEDGSPGSGGYPA